MFKNNHKTQFRNSKIQLPPIGRIKKTKKINKTSNITGYIVSNPFTTRTKKRRQDTTVSPKLEFRQPHHLP